jgi:hypothetical protein
MSLFGRCQEAYRRRYIEGEIIPPGISLLRGTGVHHGAKVNFRQKISSHKDLKKKDVVDASVAAFEEKIESDGISLTKEEKSIGKNNIIGSAKDEVVGLSEIYITEVAPEYQPVQVEQQQRIILKGKYDLMAVMDLADDKERVIDLKTTGKKKNQKDIDNSDQLSFYALVFKAINKKLPKSVRLEVLISKKKNERQMLEGIKTDIDLEILIRRINIMIEALKTGVFMPCSKDNWLCSEKWCGYFKSCMYTK